jgi:hypothetical protein
MAKTSPLTFTAVKAFLRPQTNWGLIATFSPADEVLGSGEGNMKSSPSVDRAPKTPSHVESFVIVANLADWVYWPEALGKTVFGSWKLRRSEGRSAHRDG